MVKNAILVHFILIYFKRLTYYANSDDSIVFSVKKFLLEYLLWYFGEKKSDFFVELYNERVIN